MHRHSSLELKVWGEYALFTMPEAKVERMSYPMMTPSAARGILEAILWKPEFVWNIREIHVLRPIRYQSIKRNELGNVIADTVLGKTVSNYYIEEDRQQRHSLVLRDVAYKIVADIILRPHATDDVAKYREMFRRRVAKGQCYHRPYLGCREFAAYFSETSHEDKALPFHHEIGNMLFDIQYAKDEKKGMNIPYFFDAQIHDGILTVPQEIYKVVNGNFAS